MTEKVIVTRPISEIATDIYTHWPPVKARQKADPYLTVMRSLKTLEDKVGADDGKHIVLHFLGNAQGWTGPDARRIKAELRDMIDEEHHVRRAELALSGKTGPKLPATHGRSYNRGGYE